MTIRLQRTKWLYTYRGPMRWERGSHKLGFIALALKGTEGEPLPVGTLHDGSDYVVIDNKYRAYTHRLYEQNGEQFIIGDVANYPVRAPLFRLDKTN